MVKDHVIVVDFPPGALGNFIAQIVSAPELIGDNLLSYHDAGNKKELYLSLVHYQIEELNSIKSALAEYHEGVAVCHTFDRAYALADLPHVLVYQVLVSENNVALWYNKHLKAHSVENEYTIKNTKYLLENRWDHAEPWVNREYLTLEFAHVSKWAKIPFNVTKHIEFDNFYKGQDTFVKEVANINPSANGIKLFDSFSKTQKPILDRINEFDKVMSCITAGVDYNLSNLDLIDQAAISGTLNKQYDTVEWQLPNKNTWFQSTNEIINIINTL